MIIVTSMFLTTVLVDQSNTVLVDQSTTVLVDQSTTVLVDQSTTVLVDNIKCAILGNLQSKSSFADVSSVVKNRLASNTGSSSWPGHLRS